MKKRFSVLLALALMMSVSFSLANEINWSDAEAQVASIDAEFVTLDEVGVKIWVPKVLQQTELTDEDREAGYIAFFQTSDTAYAVGVQYVDVGGSSLEEFAAAMEEIGASQIEYGTLNGLPCLTYDLAEYDSSYVAFATESGFILQFAFAPMSDENFKATASFMACSIQAAE